MSSTMSLSELVRRTTAFRDYRDLVDAMEGGYVPSLYRDHEEADFGRLVNELADRLESQGWPVFRGH